MTSYKQYGDMQCFSSVIFFVHVGVVGHNRLPFAGMLSLHETQEWLFGLENITSASIDIRMNYPFKLDLLSVAL